MSNVPDCAGVPESKPFPFASVVIVKPAGKAVEAPIADNPFADHVNGGLNAPPVAVNVSE